jgi:hypothetical protein
MNEDFLAQFYTIDEDSKKYIIDVELEDYHDIFNDWESGVYNFRSLDSSLKKFLEGCSRDIDLKYDLILRFNLHDEKRNKETEATIKENIDNYFDYVRYNLKQELNTRIKKIIFYIIFYLFFMFLSFYLQSTPGTNIVNNILLQGLTVGSWVFLWEVFSILFFNSDRLWQRKKEYKRLLEAEIRFNYM